MLALTIRESQRVYLKIDGEEIGFILWHDIGSSNNVRLVFNLPKHIEIERDNIKKGKT
jgi:sRNA-binding carbon storage regulator CsrA